jgi:hypothetical protein
MDWNIYLVQSSKLEFNTFMQYVLDAYRKGDKLKFANHSSNPNCYAKVRIAITEYRLDIPFRASLATLFFQEISIFPREISSFSLGKIKLPN